jgi:uncharacterized membrane protein
MSEDFVTVPRAALVALIEYAENAKLYYLSDYTWMKSQEDEADREFTDLIKALGVEGIDQ